LFRVRGLLAFLELAAFVVFMTVEFRRLALRLSGLKPPVITKLYLVASLTMLAACGLFAVLFSGIASTAMLRDPNADYNSRGADAVWQMTSQAGWCTVLSRGFQILPSALTVEYGLFGTKSDGALHVRSSWHCFVHL